MEREESFKETIDALKECRATNKNDIVLWIICAVLMIIACIMGIVIERYWEALWMGTLAMTQIYVVLLKRQRNRDIDILIENTELIEHMIQTQHEYNEKVKEAFAEVQAAAKEED